MIDNYLTTLRASCQQRRVPLISPESQSILLKILTTYKPKTCLEIGSAIGYSGIFIANTIKQWWGNLTSFEVAYPSYLEAQYHACQTKTTNVKRYPFDITKIEDTSNILPKQCDFVFIDAQKSQYWIYMEKIQENLSSENIIVLDDIIKYHTKLTWLYEFLNKNQINYEILNSEEWDGMMIIHNAKAKKAK